MIMNAKQIAGEKSVEYIRDGMIVGLGTGSTAYWAIQKIGELVKSGLSVKCVPTSESTRKMAEELKIPLVDIADIDKIDVSIDGADEVDKNKNLIKGGGGALLREKMIIIDHTKQVEKLGKFWVPVEVTQFAYKVTERQLTRLGCSTALRLANDKKPFITDNGNYIIDCNFVRIEKPEELTIEINQIPGVVENGLFPAMTNVVICSDSDGHIVAY